jgi:hypothetical protein
MNLIEVQREKTSLFLKRRMAEVGYPAGDIETLWMVNTVLNTEPAKGTDRQQKQSQQP